MEKDNLLNNAVNNSPSKPALLLLEFIFSVIYAKERPLNTMTTVCNTSGNSGKKSVQETSPIALNVVFFFLFNRKRNK